jgi:hypothetical protein
MTISNAADYKIVPISVNALSTQMQSLRDELQHRQTIGEFKSASPSRFIVSHPQSYHKE